MVGVGEDSEERLEDRIKKCTIRGILETREDAKEVIYEIVRTKRKITPDSIITELVYREKDVTKDEESLPLYINDRILLDGEEKDTSGLFVEWYGKEIADNFDEGGRILIPWAFGEGITKAFSYAQRKLNSTGKQRIGGEKLKDAHIFVHSARAIGILESYEATTYQKRLGALHDVPEELTDYRKEQSEKAKGKKRKQLQREIRNPPEYQEIYKLFVSRESKVKDFFYSIYFSLPPRTQEGIDRIVNRFYTFYEPEGVPIDQREARLMVYHLRLLTKKPQESYDQYVKRMVEGCLSGYAKRKIESITSDPEEQANLYAAPLIVKCADAIDNTIRVREGNISNKETRLSHNLELLKGVGNFLNKYLSSPQILKELREELITTSMDEIASIEQQYERENYLHVRGIIERFRDMLKSYKIEDGLSQKL